ncbi:hypothetical protein AMJ80_10290 [bacterium SM23_31]|nr:MAG: hypothetical protein AMJ80_10290 [bacterium SM23_31]
MNTKFILVSVFFLLIIVSCGKDNQTYTVEIKDDVRHIHNYAPQWGDEPKIALEFVQKIGDLDTEDENFQLYLPNDVAVDGEGNIYVLDAGNYRVQKYDREGKFLASFGRKGQGPGEFERPLSLAIDRNGNLYIADQGKNRVIVLTPEGKELRTFKFGERVSPFKLFSSVNILTGTTARDMIISLDEKNKEYEKPVVQIYNKDGSLKKEFGKPVDYNDMFFNSMGNSIYFTFDQNNNVFISFGYQNRIEKYSPAGELFFTSERPLNYEISRPKSKMEETSGGGLVLTMPKMNNVSSGIGVDYKGRIWVTTYRKQREKDDPEPYLELEIYDNEGILLGKIPWSEDFTPARDDIHMFGDRVFFRDSEGISVYEYKIIEK